MPLQPLACFKNSFLTSSLPWAKAFFRVLSLTNPSLQSNTPLPLLNQRTMLHPSLSPSETPHPQPSALPKPNPWVSSLRISKLLWGMTSSRTPPFPNLSRRRTLNPLRTRGPHLTLKLRLRQLLRSIGPCPLPRPLRQSALRLPPMQRLPRRLPEFPLSPTGQRPRHRPCPHRPS